MADQIVTMKLKLVLPLITKRKLERICNSNGKTVEDFIVFVLNDAISSIEKFGAIRV